MNYNFICNGNKSLGEAIHNRLLKLGYSPQNRYSQSLATENAFCIHLNQNTYHFNHIMDVGSVVFPNALRGLLDDLFNTDIYRCIKRDPIKVKLDDETEALITDEKIVVGCKKFDVSILDALTKAVKEYKNV